MRLADQGFQHEAGVLHSVEEIHDLHAVLEAEEAHVFQTRSPVNQQHDFASAAHAAANRLLSQ